jgi:hypothetical protein
MSGKGAKEKNLSGFVPLPEKFLFPIFSNVFKEIIMPIKKLIILLSTISSILFIPLVLGSMPRPTAAAGSIEPRFVSDMAGTMPLPAGAIVRVLCFNDDTPGTKLKHDLLVEIGENGRPANPLPEDCFYAAALHLRHEQPAGKANHGPAYWVYDTSWQPGSEVPASTAGDIFINEDWQLVLYNLVASLAWQPASDSTYVRRLQFGLEQASEYLYDMSDGQMAFGPVTIHTGGAEWDSADMRFLAANDYRPSAYIGGIVDQPTQYVSDTGLEHLFNPANILLGRNWDRYGHAADPTNNWATQDAYRTLVHEWAHYALFLFDEYQGEAGQLTDCTDSGNENANTDASNASIMDWHYTSSELWHPNHPTAPADSCDDTWQTAAHGLSDWATAGKWHVIQGLDASSALAIPAGLPQDSSPFGLASFLFNRTPGHMAYLPQVAGGGEASAKPIEPTLTVELTGAVGIDEVLPSDVYTVRDERFVVRQGQVYTDPMAALFPGEIDLLGVLPENDVAQVLVEQYETADPADFPSGRYVYPAPGMEARPIGELQSVTAVAQDWQMSLDAVYRFDGSLLNMMRVQLTSDNYLAELAASPPKLQLCVPDTAVGCHNDWQVEMTPVGGNRWTAVLTPLAGQDELPLYSYLRVSAAGVGEMTRWVQVYGGVGPGHIFGDAPMVDGPVMVNATAVFPTPTGCNQVIAMPATDYDALTTSLGYTTINPPTIVEGVVGQPLDIDIIMPTQAGTCPAPTPGDHGLSMAVVLTLAYDQNHIDRLPIPDETLALRLLHFDRTTQTWMTVPTADVSPDHNWISGVISLDGIYAVGWVQVPNPNP